METKKGAERMVELLQQYRELRQDEAASQLETEFGEEFVYYNENGNLAIKAEVLAAFRKLTPNVVWMRASRYWKFREPGDEPGRQQPY